MKKKNGFTLVELLAVIVILAVILIIAMPKISDVIKNSKESSLETTAKLIASQAEKKYTENQVLDGSSTIKCSDVAKISDADYESCNITFDDKGNAKVTIVGKGKFEGLQVVDGTKNSAKASVKKEIVETAAKYFSYEVFDDGLVKTLSVTVEDENKCISHLQRLGAPEEVATTLCTTNQAVDELTLQQVVSRGIIPSSDYEMAGLKVEYIIVENVEVKDANMCKSYIQADGASEEQATTLCNGNALDNDMTLKDAVKQGIIPSSDYEIAGLNVTHKPYVSSITITGYNIEGGTDVVIPSQIDGKTVVAIGDYAFTGNGVIPTPTVYNNDYKVSLLSYNSNNNYVVKPLGGLMVEGLGITSVIIPNTVTSIGRSAFRNNELTKVVIPSSVIQMGGYAFADNKLTDVELSDNIVDIENSTFRNNKLTSIILPKNLTNIYEYAFANNQLGKIFVYGNITLFNGGNFDDNPDMIIINNSNIANDDSLWKTMLNTCGTIVEGNTIKPDYSVPC